MNGNKIIEMDHPLNGVPHVLIGIVGGGLTLLNSPHVILGTLLGSGLVAFILAFISYGGQQFAKYLHKILKAKWSAYKLSKHKKL
jgi:predicted PurR-regulated permease PerM